MKIGRNKKTAKMRTYWRFLEETARRVASWPEWKRRFRS